MKEKTISILFVLLLFIFLIASLVVKDKEISYAERRNLTTIEDVFNSPLDNLEHYLSDQLPFRNILLNLYSWVDRIVLGNKENNNIYIKNDVLIEKNVPYNEKSVEEFSKKINYIVANHLKNNRVFYGIIPDKSYFLEEKGYQKINFSQLFSKIEKEITIPSINFLPLLNLEDYYKTDIHLKQNAYFKIMNELAKKYAFSLQEIEWKEQTYNPFYGATYAKGAFFSRPEELVYYKNEDTESSIAKHLEYGEKNVYDEEKLGSMDSYSVFLSGPSAWIELENQHTNIEKELILFRDSFGSSLAPLLLPYYKKITLIDLRYISLEKVEEYLSFETQDVLFLYSTLLINESNLLKVKMK